MTPRSKGWIVSVVLAILAVAVAAALGEGALRLRNRSMTNYSIEMWRYAKELKVQSDDPALDHEHRRDAAAVLQSVRISTNEWGLRGPAVPASRPGQRRILVLGSSITLGWGVNEEDVMTTRLADKFRKDGVDALVMNAGVGNYNTQRYVELFFKRLQPLEPTDIVVHYFLRDAETLEPGSSNWLLRNSELAITLWELWHRLADPSGERALIDHYKAVYRPGAPGFVTMRVALTKLAAYARTHDIRLYLALVPDVHNLERYPFAFVDETMAKVAADLGYTFVDLLPAFGHLSPQQVWAMPGDPHPNALGHRLMADELYPALRLP